jgi:hypothetical protein
MLVFTPKGQLAFVTAESGGRSRVLLLETFTEQSFSTSELRALALRTA